MALALEWYDVTFISRSSGVETSTSTSESTTASSIATATSETASISATEAAIDDGKEFDFSLPGAFLGFLQGFIGLNLNIVLEEESYKDKDGNDKTTLRVKRLKKTPADEAF